ncbi:MAG: FkbM family methyltransferase [Minisyncoccia bacterium]
MLQRFLGYFSYLRTHFGLRGAIVFMLFYGIARILGDHRRRLHRIPVGPYVFYFPLVAFFAGLFNEIFFNEEYFLEKTDSAIRVIDGGANIGVSLLYIKLQAPNAHVICIEPNPAAQIVLEKNITTNGWEKSVTIIRSALGKSTGTADFFLLADTDTDSSGSLIQKSGLKEKRRSFTVPVEPLSHHITEPIDFLKLDIEGAEFDVMDDLQTSGCLARIKHIQLEYHDEPDSPANSLSSMLQRLEHEGFKTAVRSIVSASDVISRHWRRNGMIYAWRT